MAKTYVGHRALIEKKINLFKNITGLKTYTSFGLVSLLLEIYTEKANYGKNYMHWDIALCTK